MLVQHEHHEYHWGAFDLCHCTEPAQAAPSCTGYWLMSQQIQGCHDGVTAQHLQPPGRKLEVHLLPSIPTPQWLHSTLLVHPIVPQVMFWDVRLDKLLKKGNKRVDETDVVWKPMHVVHVLSVAGEQPGGTRAGMPLRPVTASSCSGV
jgi:hypothetical protein